MRKIITITALVLVVLCANAQQDDGKVMPVAELAAAHAINSCTINASDGNGQKECEKRDTALLFILLGQREAAVRILCSTNVAIQAFRPEGALGSDEYNDNVCCQQTLPRISGNEVGQTVRRSSPSRIPPWGDEEGNLLSLSPAPVEQSALGWHYARYISTNFLVTLGQHMREKPMHTVYVPQHRCESFGSLGAVFKSY